MKLKITSLTVSAFLLIISVLPNIASADITTGLRLYYPLEETSGVTTQDLSGNGNTGTLVNNPTRSAGTIGTGSLFFDKSNDYINAGNSASIADLELQGNGGMTVAFWIKPTDLTGSIIMQKGVGSLYSWNINLNSAGRLTFVRNYSGANDLNLRFNNQLTVNVWQHIIFTWNGNSDIGSVRLYKNGILQPSPFGNAGEGTKIEDLSKVLSMGSAMGTSGVNVSLDDVRLYNRILSPAEIVELNAFTGSGGSDTSAPIRSNGAPSEVLPANTTSAIISVTTDENAICKYGIPHDVLYANMTDIFSTTGNTAHSQVVTGLTNNTEYSYHIRCQDTAGNANTDDYHISFSVADTGGGTVTFSDSLYVGNMSYPVAMEFASDGRIFVVEKGGTVRIIQNDILLPTPFASFVVEPSAEAGLLGIAFDPNFTTNGNVYVYYTATTPTLHNRVSKITASSTNPNVSDGTETILLELDTLVNSPYHNGGALHFGNDGKLYVAVGDNSTQIGAQYLSNFFGKILRLNSDGGIPTDNPTSFAGVTGTTTGNYRAIYAIGLRNPFTFNVDPLTSNIYVNDVGSNDNGSFDAYEEINLLAPGANYGWSLCEGNLQRGTANLCSSANPSFTAPVYAYSHLTNRGGGSNAAIAGGTFYRANQLPAEYNGAYFFADYIDGYIDVRMPNGEIRNVLEPTTGFAPIDIDVGPDGNLYYLSIVYWSDIGGIFKINITGNGNVSPIVSFNANPTVGTTPLSVNFDASNTIDANGGPLLFEWDFGDGTTTSGTELRLTNHLYTIAGQYVVTLKVSDSELLSDTETIGITAGNAPVGTIISPITNTIFTSGDTIYYAGSATDTEDGNLPNSAFSWTISFHHDNHAHPFLGPINGVAEGSFLTLTDGHETDTNTWYRINLTVTDSSNTTHQSYVDVIPQKANITLDSNVPGLTFTIDGESHVAPSTFQSISGLFRTISAPLIQNIAGQTYEFVSWSDAGTATHDIQTLESDTTYTATYSLVTSTLGNGLRGMWAFDAGSGTTAVDSSGNGNTGTLVNGPVWPSGMIGNSAIGLDGINDYVNFGAGTSLANLELQGNGGMAIAFWVKPNALTNSNIIRKGTGSGFSWLININPSGRLTFVRNYTGATDLNLRFNNQVVANQWQHFVLVWNGNSNISSVTLYKNGVAQPAPFGDVGVGTKNSDTSNILYLGDIFANSSINGSLDDVRLYNRLLSAPEVAELYNYR